MSYAARVGALPHSCAADGVDGSSREPLFTYICTRPLAPGSVNSAWSMPIFRSTHSVWSASPVATAMSGMSPSERLRGMRVRDGGRAVVVHAAMLGMVSWRRQRPSWMTSGMSAPTGTLPRVNVPSGAVCVATSGLPVTSPPHWLHCTPAAKGSTGPFGT